MTKFRQDIPIEFKPFANADGHRVRINSFKGLATRESGGEKVTNIDFVMPFYRRIDGVQLFLENHAWDDWIEFFVLTPQGVPVDRFGERYEFDDSRKNQGWVKFNFYADIPKDFQIRVAYHAAPGSGVIKVKGNLSAYMLEGVSQG